MSRLSWDPNKDPEWEDREAFLKLSSGDKWKYLMRLIMQTKKLPEGAGKFSKRKIEWN
ncbi:MAG: hypothetical protein WD555_03195 [Fulvivirga sp.]